ncbi:MAG: hypothetical protein ACU0CO_13120 [Shimia sp.]
MLRHKIYPFATIALVLLSACGRPDDVRQVVGGTDLGLIFFAQVVSVVETRSSGEPLAQTSVAISAAGDFAGRSISPDRLTATAGIAAVQSFTRALTGRSSGAGGGRCLYVVETDDPRIRDALPRAVLAAHEGHAVEPLDDELDRYVSVAQSCDPRLVPASEVFLSLTRDATTIHPIDPGLRRVRDARHGALGYVPVGAASR